MSTAFGQNIPVSEVLGSSYRDLGGVGEEPAQLKAGLNANGVSETKIEVAPKNENGFDAILKTAEAAPAAPQAKPNTFTL